MSKLSKKSSEISQRLFDSFHAMPGFPSVYLSYAAGADQIDLTEFHENMTIFSNDIYIATVEDNELKFYLSTDRTKYYQPSQEAVLIIPGEEKGLYRRFIETHPNITHKVFVKDDGTVSVEIMK